MKVKRIVSNVATSDVDKASAFYKEILGLKVLMDLGWIRTFGSTSKMTIQVSVMSEGGSGTAVPDISIEVDNVEEALMRVEKRVSLSNTARRPSRGECAGSTSVIHSES